MFLPTPPKNSPIPSNPKRSSISKPRIFLFFLIGWFFNFLSYLGFLNPPQCTWVVYGISQFREQRSDWKPCVTRNEDEDHYLAPPNFRIKYVARGRAHVAQVYILYYGGQSWRRWWAIESQLANWSPPRTFRPPPLPIIHQNKLVDDQRFYYWQGWWSSWMIPITGFVHVGGPWIATGVSWKGEDSNS